MATIVSTTTAAEFFVSTDVYKFDVDNRPLQHLLDNDIAINTELVATTAEVVQARTGLSQTYGSLDARLDDLELAAGYPQKQVAYNEFRARAQAWQARYASGALLPLTEIVKISDTWAWPPGIASLNADTGYGGFNQIFLHDEGATVGANRIFLGNGLEPRYSSGSGVYDFLKYRPLHLSVAGFLIDLFNEAGGALTTGLTNEICFNLPAAPSANGRVDFLWLEVWFHNVPRTSLAFKPYGAAGSLSADLTTADDSSLRGNVGFWGGNNGDYFQVRHRLRVSTVANPDLNPFGMSDTANVIAQGGNSSVPSSGTYTQFRSAAKEQGDPGLWVAGDGSSSSKSTQVTIDGYVYAIPVALVFRRNTGQWTISNQNGSRTSAGAGTWSTLDSARPDGYYHDKIEKGDVTLVAPSAVSERTNLKRVLEESFDRLLRGQLKTKHGYLDYSTLYEEATFGGTNETVGGTEIVEAICLDGSGTQAKTVQMKEPGGSPLCKPDDFRRLFSPQTETQPVGFTLDIQSSVGTPANFASIAASVVTIKAIGNGGVGSPTAVVSEAPVLWWSGSKKPVALTGSWSGLNTGTLTATLNTGDANYSATGIVVGLVKVTFPAMGNTFRKANSAVVGQIYTPPASSALAFSEVQLLGADRITGPTGVAVDATYYYLCDSAHKAWKVNRSTGAVANTFGVHSTSGADNTHLNSPSSIAVDGSGNVYIADTKNHRVIKLSSAMAYVGQFGVTGVSGTDNSHLKSPEGVAVDGSGNIYISDTLNYRVVKISSAFSYLSAYGVVGVSVADNTHTVLPHHAYFGDDSNLYVADHIRVLIINPSTMAAITFIENGYQIPGSRVNTVQAIDPSGSIASLVEDSSGNKYVLHSTGGFDMPGNHVGYFVSKYDSNWAFQLRYGARWDTEITYGGINAGTTNGLVFGHDIILDEANNVLHIFDGQNSADSVNGAVWENRIISIRASDLTLYQVRASNPVPTSGSVTPYGPIYGNRTGSGITFDPIAVYSLQWPTLKISGLEFDSVNHYLYIAYGSYADTNYSQDGWMRIEKWSISGTDPNSWTFVNSFGTMDVANFSGVGFRWRAWFSSAMDSTRMVSNFPGNGGMSISRDGSALFITDQHTVIKLNTSGTNMAYVGRFGFTTIPGNDSGHMSFYRAAGQVFYGMIQAFVANEADTNGRIYVSDTNNGRIVILKNLNNFNTSGSPGAWVTSFINTRVQQSFSIPFGQSYALTTGAAKIWFKPTLAPFGLWELNVAGVNRDAPVYVDANVSTFATVYAPLSFSALPFGIDSLGVYGLAKVSGKLFFSATNTNQLAAVQTPDYRFLGECGTPGTGGHDRASWSHPLGLAADASTRTLYICDHANARLIICDQHVAFVEQNVGRVEFLLPPDQTSTWYGHSRFTAFQGVYTRGRALLTYNSGDARTWHPVIAGRNVLVAPENILVTTMGKGSSEGLSDPGINVYANCIQRLPIPLNGLSEVGVRPQEFALAGGILPSNAHYLLPLLGAFAASRNNYRGENESYWQRDTYLGGDERLVQRGLRGGVQCVTSRFAALVGPKLLTFNCAQIPNYRYLVAPFLVVVEGEILLAVRVTSYSSSSSAVTGGSPVNSLGTSANDIIELYRPVGHPMIPHNGESDFTLTLA